MKTLKRTVYHIAGKDYESNQVITMTFNLQIVSIQTILDLAKSKQLKVVSFGQPQPDYPIMLKSFVLRGFAFQVALFLADLGVKDHNEVFDNFTVRHHAFRRERIRSRCDGISCYDPQTHITTMKSNSPVKIEGRQQIINGKLWRRIY